jgi:hypothetical protein
MSLLDNPFDPAREAALVTGSQEGHGAAGSPNPGSVGPFGWGGIAVPWGDRRRDRIKRHRIGRVTFRHSASPPRLARLLLPLERACGVSRSGAGRAAG